MTDEKREIIYQGRIWSGTQRQLRWLTSLNGRITLKTIKQEKKSSDPLLWRALAFLTIDDTGQLVSLLILMSILLVVALILV